MYYTFKNLRPGDAFYNPKNKIVGVIASVKFQTYYTKNDEVCVTFLGYDQKHHIEEIYIHHITAHHDSIFNIRDEILIRLK